jgi:DNA-binding NarL/FixJ family response regulator
MQPDIHEAVIAVYSNVSTVSGNDVNSLTAFDINYQPVTIDSAKVTEQLAILQDNYTAQKTAKATARASAIAKLIALGLTTDEISALLGK